MHKEFDSSKLLNLNHAMNRVAACISTGPQLLLVGLGGLFSELNHKIPETGNSGLKEMDNMHMLHLALLLKRISKHYK